MKPQTPAILLALSLALPLTSPLLSPQAASAKQPRQQQAEQEPLPDLPHEPIFKTDAQGRVVPLTRPAHEAALEVNPMIDAEILEQCLPIIEERRERTRRLVLENLDLIAMARSGTIEEVSVADRPSVARIVELLRPFVPEENLAAELARRGVLNETQARFNAKIVNDYKLPLRRQFIQNAKNPDGTKPSDMDALTRFFLHDGIEEATLAYESLLLALHDNAEHAIKAAGLEGEAADAVRHAAMTDPDRATTIELMEEALKKVPLRQQRPLLAAAIKTN